ncbi:MAG TPA: hypothetical protein VHF92_03350 [Geodermatophilus sp.]|nr:hypothetical protein [Geodermatophilus sp.]
MEVDVPPAEGKGLAAALPGCRHQAEPRLEPVAGHLFAEKVRVLDGGSTRS